jgi:hypothetical protein
MNTQDVAAARWGIAFHSNSSNPRAKRWYRVARMVYADSGWFELYWHESLELRGGNLSAIRHKARELGLDVLPGVFRDFFYDGRRGSEMEREL